MTDRNTDKITKVLKKNRPNISDSTIRTYTSILSTLYRNMGTSEPVKEYFCENSKQVIKYINEHYEKASARKTRMAALISFCSNEDAKNQYREVMNANAVKVQGQYESQEKTENEKDNWINYGDIEKKLEILKERTNSILKLRDANELPMHEIQEVQQYVILSLYVLLEPRRLLDYTMCKYKNYDTDTDNYIDMKNKKIVFNVYKTAKKYGKQELDLPDRLTSIFKKWFEILDGRSDYLLVDRNFDALSVSQLQQRLNKIFGGKKISVNIIRHSYLSNKYGDGPSLKSRLETAANMGHSLEMQMEYIKK